MRTAFKTGPGFFAANTNKVDPSVPAGCMRILCARLEAYDMPLKASPEELATSFELLVAKAEKDPRIARACLTLADCINKNRPLLEEAAKR